MYNIDFLKGLGLTYSLHFVYVFSTKMFSCYTIKPVYKPLSIYCRNAEKQRDTIKTSLLSVILIYLLNLFLNSALLFLGP